MLETRCQVLDIELPYNIILGRPWIHAMKDVPSMYHQSLKFPFNGTEITMPRDPNPFELCPVLQGSYKNSNQVPNNDKAHESPLYVDSEKLKKASEVEPNLHPIPKIKAHIHYIGFSEYDISKSCCVGRMPLSPKSTANRP